MSKAKVVTWTMGLLVAFCLVSGLASTNSGFEAERLETLSSFWFDDFSTTTLNSSRWVVVSGTPLVNSNGNNEPSPSYSLNLDGTDAVETTTIDLSNKQSVMLSFYYQNSGTERGDDLVLKFYYNEFWFDLKRYSGETSTGTSAYVQDQIAIPAFALTNQFKLKLETESDSNYDDWFIDDIMLYMPPSIGIAYQPTPFTFSLDLGDSTNGTVTINNTGAGELNYSISSRGRTSPLLSKAVRINENGAKAIEIQEVVNALRNRVDFSNVNSGPQLADETDLPDHETTTPEKAVCLKFSTTTTSGINVGLLGSDSNISKLEDVQSKLLTTGQISSATTINTYNVTPTLAELQAFDAVLVWTNSPINNATLLGNVLADYVDGGGGVVCAVFSSVNDENYYVAGRFSDYRVIELGFYNTSSRAYLGTVHQPSHPIMQGVSSLDGGSSSYRPSTGVVAGANRIADWSDGSILVGTRMVNGHRRADLGLYPPSSDVSTSSWIPTTDGATLMANALSWVSNSSDNNWLSLTPSSGTVAAGASANVTAKVSTVGLVPDTTYLASVVISSNDPVHPDTSFAASLMVNPVNYYVDVTHVPEDSSASRGETITYHVNVKNLGSLADNYILTVSENVWPTTIWNAAGTSQIANTGTIASRASKNVVVKVVVPANADYHATDTVKLAAISVGSPAANDYVYLNSYVVKPANELPLVEDFESVTLDTNLWIGTTGTPEINTYGENEPSPPYSLELAGSESISSLKMKLAGKTYVRLEYYYQNDNTEQGDDLVVSCYTPGYWVELVRHDGNDPELAEYQKHSVNIPAFALTDSFRVRFASSSDYSSDEWFVDNIRLYEPPTVSITSTPSPLNFTLSQGDSTTGALTITNTGNSDLEYALHCVGRVGNSPTNSLNKKAGEKAYPESYYSHNLSKGDIDTRKGAPVVMGAGGPDDFGYSWVDSDEPGGPAFSWVDISTQGTRISGLGDDTNVGPFPIGFSFPFYGNHFDTFRFSSNGLISFTSNSTRCTNEPIPNVQVFDLVAPFWDDLRFSSSSSAYYYFDGSKLIIQYSNVYHYESGGPYTFEVFLYPSGNIVYQYLTMGSPTNSCTVGIQNSDGSDGLEIAFNTSYIHNNMAILISGTSNWMTFSTMADTLRPGASHEVQLGIQSRGLIPDSTYLATVVVESNAGSSPDTLAASLTVNALPYYFDMSTTSTDLSTIPGQTVDCSITVTNLGRNPDSYVLNASGNQWPTTFWNEYGSQIQTVPLLNAKASYTFVARIEVPTDQLLGAKDSANVRITSSGNTSLNRTVKIVTSAEWRDNFETAQLDTNKWTIVSGVPEVNDQGENEPSGMLSLELNSYVTVESKIIDLRSFTGRRLFLSFYWQNDDTETGDDLVVRIYQGTYWIELLRLSGNSTELSTYTKQVLEIPEFAFAETFKVQFKCESDYTSDEWFIDNVVLSDSTSTDVNDTDGSAIPTSFNLYQNYPNPFNPTTSIRYDLPQMSPVKIQIFNALGKEVAVLEDTEKNAGSYTVQWDARDMHGNTVTSGLYFYRIIAGDFMKVRKFMLLK